MTFAALSTVLVVPLPRVFKLVLLFSSYLLVIEREIIRFEDLKNQTRILQAETKVVKDKIQKRYDCYFNCNPNAKDNPCFKD